LIARNVYPLESEVHTGNGRRGGRSRRGGRGNRGRRPLLSSSPMSGRSIDNNQRGTLIFVYTFFAICFILILFHYLFVCSTNLGNQNLTENHSPSTPVCRGQQHVMEAPRGHFTETSIRSPRGTPIHRGHLIQTPSRSTRGTPISQRPFDSNTKFFVHWHPYEQRACDGNTNLFSKRYPYSQKPCCMYSNAYFDTKQSSPRYI
jgi:hypothetical protein